jgi:hypothetical protein
LVARASAAAAIPAGMTLTALAEVRELELEQVPCLP